MAGEGLPVGDSPYEVWVGDSLAGEFGCLVDAMASQPEVGDPNGEPASSGPGHIHSILWSLGPLVYLSLGLFEMLVDLTLDSWSI